MRPLLAISRDVSGQPYHEYAVLVEMRNDLLDSGLEEIVSSWLTFGKEPRGLAAVLPPAGN